MLTLKAIVFMAVVVALAVNVVAWRRYEERPGTTTEVHHQMDPLVCALDPTWQCANTVRFHECMGDEQCLITQGVAI